RGMNGFIRTKSPQNCIIFILLTAQQKRQGVLKWTAWRFWSSAKPVVRLLVLFGLGGGFGFRFGRISGSVGFRFGRISGGVGFGGGDIRFSRLFRRLIRSGVRI